MEQVKILFTGDFCPHLRVEELAVLGRFDKIYNDFNSVLHGNDLNVIDLECPLTDSKSRIRKSGPHLKASARCVEILKYGDVSLAALANNHIMDYGVNGLTDTLSTCREAGINTFGAGMDMNEARKPYEAVLKAKRISILNFAENEFSNTYGNHPGANPLNLTNNFYDIRQAKRDNDFAIVVVHGGNEFYDFPSPRMKQVYRFFVEAGADAVISHHTHHYSGYEVYHGKPIFYGLGNFMFDWPGRTDEKWNYGYVVRLLLSRDIDFEVIPLKQNTGTAGVLHLKGSEVQDFRARIEFLNSVIAADERLEHEFEKYCNSVAPMYESFIEPYFGKLIAALRKRGMFPKLMNQRKKLLMLNIIRCESHRDVLLKNLSDK